jgi:hypothetical protein
LVLAEKH